MLATSLASAVEGTTQAEILPLRIVRLRRPASPPLWREAFRRRVWRSFFPLLYGLRQSLLYSHTLYGYLADRFPFVPEDHRPTSLEEAEALIRGRFHLAGQTVEVVEGSIFDKTPPGAGFAAALHGFDWLRHLEAAGSDAARSCALTLLEQWLKRSGHYGLPAWQPAIMAERLVNILAHARFCLTNTDTVWRSKLFVSLRNQIMVLSRSVDETEEGLPRLKAAAGLVIAGLCLGNSSSRAVKRGLAYLDRAIEQQIYEDGGHITRSPAALFEAFCALSAAQRAIEQAQWPGASLRQALDRIGAMLRFLSLGDGQLALFNGGHEGEAKLRAALLPAGKVLPEQLFDAPQSGFQRLAAGRSVVLVDAGPLPRNEFSADAHAGCLSFEFSSGPHRMIVNCGAAPAGVAASWSAALRSTAAHSTLTLDDTSQAQVLTAGPYAKMFGPRMSGGPSVVETRRTQSAQGFLLESTHDAYVPRYGLLHQRRLTLSPNGTTLAGGDRLIATDRRQWARARRAKRRKDGEIGFALRFHVHPDVKLSLAQAKGTVLLKLPSGEGWRFRCAGGTLSIEDSIYFGSGAARRCEQIVVTAIIDETPAEAAWVFERVDAA